MHQTNSLTRRELLRIGAVSVFAGATTRAVDVGASSPKSPNRCIFILLQGGPSHHDLWDPKPDASAEIRGPFQSIATTLPGVRFGELLQHTAPLTDRLAVIRSVTHGFTNHIAGTYITLTGSENQPNQDREAKHEDFPGPGAILNYLDRGNSSVPRSVSLPTWLSIPGPSNRMPGQYGGFLGGVHNPFLIDGDPNDKQFQPLALTLPRDCSADRLRGRLSLVQQLDQKTRYLEEELQQRYDHLRHSAYEMVANGQIRKALDLNQESRATRDRYGRNKLGQSLLLARRLIEAGVQLVGYNEFNQKWDTHGGLFKRYKDIVPPLDRAFSALIEDLDQRGLLDSTLVVNTGEFGRTPVINKGAGRDHWPNVYSTVLAGGGIRGGQVFGSSDRKGAEVATHRVSPADILATLWHQLGISPRMIVHDRLERPHMISSGRVISQLV